MSSTTTNPPASSRGVTRIIIDWLTYTVPRGTAVECVPPHKVFAGREGMDRVPPPYTHGAMRGCAETYWSDDHPEFKLMVRLPGEALENMRHGGYQDQELLAWVVAKGANVTRVDVAIDRFGDERADVNQVWQSHEMGYLETTARKVLRYHEEDTGGKRMGCTVYIGSRTSNWFIRVYDKGAQKKTKAEWARVEAEIKGDAAKAMAVALAGDMRQIQHEVARRVDPALPWFDDMMSGAENATDVIVPRAETDTEGWLYGVALAAVEKAVRRGDPYVISRLEGLLFGIGQIDSG